MDAGSLFLGRKLIERIESSRMEYLKPLINGQAADYPDYRARAAYLRALADVQRWISEIDAEEEERDRARV
jgi:hypothetical protein